MPTETRTDTDPQRYLLSTVRQTQAAVLDNLRTWTAVTEQVARTFRWPVPEVDVAGIVDRAFDVAEQTLAAQHQLARTLAGVAARQVDSAVAAVDSAVAEEPSETAPPRQDRKFDGRTYEERSVEELRERAAEVEIEGRSSMSKDELITALRSHRQSRSASRKQAK
jgi:hypothetical protein